MKCFIITLSLILAVVLAVGEPAGLAQKSPVLSPSKGTPEPTPPPPTAPERKEESPPTPIPTEKPTAMPTPTSTVPPPTPTPEPPTSEPTNPPPTATPLATITPVPAETPTAIPSPTEKPTAIPTPTITALPASKPPPATSTTMVTGSTILAILFLAFTGVTSLLQTMAVRSLTRTYRQQKTHEMEYRQYQVIARRKAEIEQLLADDGDWRQVLKQVIADAVPGVSPTWLTVMDVSATPVPHFDVTGEDGKRYTFTISPSFAFPWRARAIPLDASLSPAMRVEVQVIWEYLTEQQGIELPLLPRRAGWYLVAQEQLRKKDKKTRQ